MRIKILFIYIFLLILTSCGRDINSGVFSEVDKVEKLFSRKNATHCLRDFIVGEDDGGTWTIISAPSGFNPNLAGDNPCLDFSVSPSGSYTLRYTVTTACCSAYTDVFLIKCGLSASSICNN